jgi:hypothetical protein
MTKIKVKKFWMKPENPSVGNFSEFSFGYNKTDKNYSYHVSINPRIKESEKALHDLFWLIKDSKKGSYLPWTAVPGDLKSKLIITNEDDPQTSFLPELLTKVGNRLNTLNVLLRQY